MRLTSPSVPILAGFSQRRSCFYEPIGSHQEHEINVALSGGGVYRLRGGRTTALAAGEILLLPGGISHGIEVEHHFRMAVIHFHPRAFRAVSVSHGAERNVLERLKTWTRPLPCRKVTAPDILGLLERLTEEAVVEQNRQSPAREAMLESMATQMAVYFLRLMVMEPSPAAADESENRVLLVRSWIDRHFTEPCGVESLAEMACLAPTYFAARFRQVIGVTPMAFVRNRRLEQARLLLERTRQPVNVIAWSVGFADVSHFNHVFKKRTGETPVNYRIHSQTPSRPPKSSRPPP